MGQRPEGMGAVRAYYGLAIAASMALLAVVGSFVAGLALPIVDLLFGVAGTLALCVLSLVTARHVRRAGAAMAALQAEAHRRQLAEDALHEAQKMGAVGRLTGGIAHDFNNQLTVISSNLELLMRRLPSVAPDSARLANAAMKGVQRAAGLTQRLLSFARQQSFDPEPLNVGQLVTGMLDLLRRTLGEGILVETVSSGGLWLTRVDADQLESALLNLAVNARDAMPHGGRLTIETANVALGESGTGAMADPHVGQCVMIAVHDTGAGMPPEVRARAFEPFFTTKPAGEGAGFGLTMVHGFVRQSGGHIKVESSPGEGTTVRLYLPRYFQQLAPMALPGSGAARAPDAAETVLVVEDDDAVRMAAAAALREIGYAVLEAPDAMEAVRLLADRGGIDLLFTDIGLPGGVNGRALADAARSIDPALRVLFTTGHTQDALAHDDGRFLAKPFSLEQLEAKVREVLDLPRAEHGVCLRTESA